MLDVKMEEDEASKIQNEPNVVSDQDDGNKEEQGSILNQVFKLIPLVSNILFVSAAFNFPY